MTRIEELLAKYDALTLAESEYFELINLLRAERKANE